LSKPALINQPYNMAATQVETIVRQALLEPEAIPISVKEMLAKLAGAFPFDEAVVEGGT
jgi:hypothetical protein